MSDQNNLIYDLPRMVSVDVETAGPNPADYALLSIGACTLAEPRATFYAELKPVQMKTEAGALEVHKLDLNKLKEIGLPPEIALQQLADWLSETIIDERGPLFVGFNSPFDWMFLNDYFHKFLGSNPFGHSSLDIKSFTMGLKRVPWEKTKMAVLSSKQLRHNALEDALDQADLFLDLLKSEGIL